MSMAAAYASVAARGWYCEPKALARIVTSSGQQVKLLPNSCHRDMSKAVADAANYILQGVLVSGTAAGRGIGRPAAGKTGTANGGFYAAFAGYTPTLAGYVSVFNPTNPTSTRRDGLPALLLAPVRHRQRAELRQPDVRQRRAWRDLGVQLHARAS